MKRTALLLYLLVIGFSAYSQWLTDVRYNDHNTGITLGYVNQQFQFTDGDFQNYGDGIWGQLAGWGPGCWAQPTGAGGRSCPGPSFSLWTQESGYPDRG